MSAKFKAVVFGSGKISSHLPKLFKFLSCDFVYYGKSYDFNFNDVINDGNNNDTNEAINKVFKENVEINSNHITISDEIKYVFLAVPDQQIQKAFEDLKNTFSPFVRFIHLSGTMYFDNIIGAHPLMTFNAETQIEDYSKIKIFTDNEFFYTEHKAQMKSLNYVRPEDKGVYHAMASMLGNFTQYYLYTLKNNFPEGIHFESYEQLVLASVSSMFQKDEFEKLTGPLIRGDIDTIEKHKCALKKDNPKLLEIYQSFENLFFEEIKS